MEIDVQLLKLQTQMELPPNDVTNLPMIGH